ncbi:DNA-directed RNA polymerase III 47 kDa polypeptide [Actinacidiphila cocklensis]|uniref:DNA-directed RNA polymerase III 47 kDa polypeptide n=1 Tax=Actinacidiphila cocklensis TaxID=887465 RepID=A0A9W4DTK1_9ACTN|nr:DNA-directed RNA polymerase III 47 kDa polypeptide [Actinacidiphila cocklensis]
MTGADKAAASPKVKVKHARRGPGRNRGRGAGVGRRLSGRSPRWACPRAGRRSARSWRCGGRGRGRTGGGRPQLPLQPTTRDILSFLVSIIDARTNRKQHCAPTSFMKGWQPCST